MNDLKRLAETWMKRALKQFECMDRTESEMGKRVMQHGAMVYFNCATEIQELIDKESKK